MRPPRSRAFTLLEMVVVLAIIGVMASLALPSWRSAQLRGISNDARTVLERLDLQQKRHWQRYARYASAAELPAFLRMSSFAWSHSAGSGETGSAPPWDTRSFGPDSVRGIWPLTDRSSGGDAGSTGPAGRFNPSASLTSE